MDSANFSPFLGWMFWALVGRWHRIVWCWSQTCWLGCHIASPFQWDVFAGFRKVSSPRYLKGWNCFGRRDVYQIYEQLENFTHRYRVFKTTCISMIFGYLRLSCWKYIESYNCSRTICSSRQNVLYGCSKQQGVQATYISSKYNPCLIIDFQWSGAEENGLQ